MTTPHTRLEPIWRGYLLVVRFTRFPAYCLTAILPLLGGVSASSQLTAFRIAVVLVVAGCFHIFAYVLNDVIDLPVDRTQSLRQRDPLVSGIISPRRALGIALVQIPLALALTAAPLSCCSRHSC
jgi:4-hydroxybenzoate polyprenyltransferase